MDLRTYWTAVGLAFAVTCAASLLPRVKRRYLWSAGGWLVCALFLYAKADDLGIVAVPAAALIALTALKLVQVDSPTR